MIPPGVRGRDWVITTVFSAWRGETVVVTGGRVPALPEAVPGATVSAGAGGRAAV
jgi:hypothetical protein